MVKIVSFIRPHRLEQVKTALSALGITGITVNDVRGSGNSPEQSTWFAGQEMVIALPIRSKITLVVDESMQEAVIETIIENTRTGESGDGKIFIEPVSDAIRVRTGERGDLAV